MAKKSYGKKVMKVFVHMAKKSYVKKVMKVHRIRLVVTRDNIPPN